jgi:hypothetical protein
MVKDFMIHIRTYSCESFRRKPEFDFGFDFDFEFDIGFESGSDDASFLGWSNWWNWVGIGSLRTIRLIEHHIFKHLLLTINVKTRILSAVMPIVTSTCPALSNSIALARTFCNSKKYSMHHNCNRAFPTKSSPLNVSSALWVTVDRRLASVVPSSHFLTFSLSHFLTFSLSCWTSSFNYAWLTDCILSYMMMVNCIFEMWSSRPWIGKADGNNLEAWLQKEIWFSLERNTQNPCCNDI